jgi:hypothetical protein
MQTGSTSMNGGKSMSFRVSWAFVAGAAVSVFSVHWPAAAQARFVGNVLVRADLKAPTPPKTTSGGAFAAAGQGAAYLTCPRGVCQTPILVSRGGFTDDKLTKWDPNHCSVYWPYFALKVPKRFQPTMRWVLVKDPDDTAAYSFHATYGIQLVPNPFDPTDYNDPSQDLFNYRLDARDGTAFVWQNLHTRPTTKIIYFLPVVYKVGSEDKPCNASDPMVVNES